MNKNSEFTDLEPEFQFLKKRLGFPGGSVTINPPANAEDAGLITGLGRSPREGNGNHLQDSGLDSSMVCIVHGITKSLT